MKKKQFKTPQRERGSSQKNSLVCRQCGKSINDLTDFLGYPTTDRFLYDICTDCFIKKRHYDPRQKNIDFNPDSF